MLKNLQLDTIVPIIIVISSISLLIYFAWKTLITSNLFQKGLNFYQQKDYQNAEAVFRNVTSINSTNDVVRLLLGDTLLKQGKVEQAIEKYQEVIIRAPKKVDAYLRLSRIYMQQEQKSLAIEYLQKAKEVLQKRQPEKAEEISQLLEKLNQ
ncbi:tetratricopeptide repeat protein [Plectonema cf. radiosum LEGE 06105]|uniref:Tetratricopeptide repeat protein n=1 Tax=Plectonema cf. radiosum LEGE 06105 TaxID=945769 RepID=A0A8J7F3X1_9CYAN|nr:tetratricopeptide repeat protein [Plectonema radiosum]MBE9214622.1 tetratricopeptide repeat protein [Plectonema cf. radiosum LEGE 06105]